MFGSFATGAAGRASQQPLSGNKEAQVLKLYFDLRRSCYEAKVRIMFVLLACYDKHGFNYEVQFVKFCTRYLHIRVIIITHTLNLYPEEMNCIIFCFLQNIIQEKFVCVVTIFNQTCFVYNLQMCVCMYISVYEYVCACLILMFRFNKLDLTIPQSYFRVTIA